MKITDKDKKLISDAVKKAESKTSGEIATAFIKESYDYAINELLFSVVIGFIYFIIMMAFSIQIENWLSNMFWNYNSNYLLGFYGFSTFSVISFFYLIGNTMFIDRLIISKKMKQQKVHERALRYFVESGVYNTVHRTGILIFVSVLEQRVELLADSGINELIPQEKWDKIVAHVVTGVKQKEPAKFLSEAISDCGDLLAEYFPIMADDENELSNEIEMLEK